MAITTEKLTFFGSNILVQPEKKQEQVQVGIIIPVVVFKDIETAIVIKVSENILHLKPGDRIMYPAGTGILLSIDGESYKVIKGPVIDNPGDIIAII